MSRIGKKPVTIPKGVEVHVGAPSETLQRLVELYMKGNLPSGVNVCDH